MSFLSSQRLHWGEHDSLTGHLWTHLELHVHDLPLHPAPPDAASRSPDDRKPERKNLADHLLPDVPGP